MAELRSDFVAELSQHGEQQVGGVEPIAVDQGDRAILFDRVDETVDENRLARQRRTLQQGEPGRVLKGFLQHIQCRTLRLIRYYRQRFPVRWEGLFKQACCR